MKATEGPSIKAIRPQPTPAQPSKVATIDGAVALSQLSRGV